MASKVTFGGDLAFPNDYLASEECKGRDWPLTIKDIQREPLRKKDGSSELKFVLRFAETPKKIVLNKTNAESIAVMYGAEMKKWLGKRITVYPTMVPAFGKMTAAIRVREKVPPPPKGQQAATAPAAAKPTNGSQPAPAPSPEPATEPDGEISDSHYDYDSAPLSDRELTSADEAE